MRAWQSLVTLVSLTLLQCAGPVASPPAEVRPAASNVLAPRAAPVASADAGEIAPVAPRPGAPSLAYTFDASSAYSVWSFEPSNIPAANGDGSLVVWPVSTVASLGAPYNFRLEVRRVDTGALVRKLIVLTEDESNRASQNAERLVELERIVHKRVAMVNQFLAAPTWHPLVEFDAHADPYTSNGASQEIAAGDLHVSYSEPRLTVSQGSAIRFSRQMVEWQQWTVGLRPEARDICRPHPLIASVAPISPTALLIHVTHTRPAGDWCGEPDRFVVAPLKR